MDDLVADNPTWKRIIPMATSVKTLCPAAHLQLTLPVSFEPERTSEGRNMSKKSEAAEKIYEAIIHQIDERDGKALPSKSLKHMAKAFSYVSSSASGRTD